jgi:hypothetical protein
VAAQKSRRKSRKRRSSQSVPRAVPSDRRRERGEQRAAAAQADKRATRQLGTEGERPRGLFGEVPVSEFAILAGGICATVGIVNSSGVTLIVGLIVCALGVVEVTAREHFSGFRSHSSLLAGIPAVAAGALFNALVHPRERGLLLLVIVPVFAVLFWALRDRFQRARQARVRRRVTG